MPLETQRSSAVPPPSHWSTYIHQIQWSDAVYWIRVVVARNGYSDVIKNGFLLKKKNLHCLQICKTRSLWKAVRPPSDSFYDSTKGTFNDSIKSTMGGGFRSDSTFHVHVKKYVYILETELKQWLVHIRGGGGGGFHNLKMFFLFFESSLSNE